jgi:DNA-binding MarR family transcriptional regulator
MTLRLIPAIHRVTHGIALFLHRERALRVTQAEAHILAHLASAGESTVNDLWRAFGHKRSTLTSILDRLATRGLITREPGSEDRRTVVIALTRAGAALATKVAARLAELEAQLLRHLPGGSATALVESLDEIARRLREAPR